MRFSDSTCTITAVPTSAPSITASAAAVVSSPWATNDDVSSAVAVELCSNPVTPSPARNAVPWPFMLRLSTCLNPAP